MPAVTAQGHREDLGLETGALARGTRHLAHVALVPLLLRLRFGLLEPALEERHDALELGVVRPHPPVAVAVAHADLGRGTAENGLTHLRGQLLPRGAEVETHVVSKSGQELLEVVRALAARPRGDRTVRERDLRIGYHQVRIDLEVRSETVTHRARTVRRVERERPGLHVVQGDGVTVGAGHVLGEAPTPARVRFLEIHVVDHDHTVREAERGLHGIGEPLPCGRLGGETVHHHLDVVLLLLLQRRGLREGVQFPVHPDAAVPVSGELGEEVHELALACTDHRRQDLEADALLALQDLVDDLLGRLPRHLLTTGGTVRDAGPGVQQPEIVVHLGDGADGRARVPVGGLLVDRHRRGETLDEVDIRLVHLAEEHPRIRREGLDIAPLPLREDRVERQRGFARPRQTGEHDQRLSGDVDIHALEVVLTRAADDQPVHHGGSPSGGRSPHCRTCRMAAVPAHEGTNVVRHVSGPRPPAASVACSYVDFHHANP